jgi:hypothetical protein
LRKIECLIVQTQEIIKKTSEGIWDPRERNTRQGGKKREVWKSFD